MPSRQEIVHSINEGIRKAECDYRKGTTWMLHQGPEYFMTVNIYQSLLRLTNTSSLTLEDEPSRLTEWHRNRRRRLPGPKPFKARLDGRCDLALFCLNAYDKPRAVIEIKRNAQKCTDDLERVKRLLEEEHLGFCVLASCLFERVENNKVVEAQDKIRKRLRDLRRKINNALVRGNMSLTLSRSRIEKVLFEMSDGDEEWVWRPICCVISRKKTS